jgi:hypothetical protein
MVDCRQKLLGQEKFSVEKERAGRFGGNLPASDCALGERCSRHLAEAREEVYVVSFIFVPHLSNFFYGLISIRKF